MTAAATYLHTPILAWSVSAEDEERFKRILKQGLEAEPLPEEEKAPEKRRYAFARPGSDIFH